MLESFEVTTKQGCLSRSKNYSDQYLINCSPQRIFKRFAYSTRQGKDTGRTVQRGPKYSRAKILPKQQGGKN